MNGVPFTVAAGRAAGLTDAQMRGAAFSRPFHGIRVTGTLGRIDRGFIDRCHDLRAALPANAVFSHTTAARLWGMPLPLTHSAPHGAPHSAPHSATLADSPSLTPDGSSILPLAESHTDPLHVTTCGGAQIRRHGVIGWRTRDPLPQRAGIHGVGVLSPADTWVSLAVMSPTRGGAIEREWLVAIGDFLVSGRRRSGRRGGREAPLATLAELRAAVARHGSRRGAAALGWALERIRMPVDSPQETFVRLGLVAARLPEPRVQPPVMTAEGIRHPDLGYLEHRVLIEYLGDVHRTDPRVWRQDLVRVQLFEDAGFRVIMAGADDVTPAGLPGFVSRVRRALHDAGPRR